MRRLFHWSTTLVIAVLCPLPSTPTSAADRPLAANAALQYWSAFALIPEFTEAEAKAFANGDAFVSAPLDETARGLAGRIGLALGFLRRGAELEQCDWGQDTRRDGPFTLLPYLSKIRRLGGLVCLRARVRMADGDSEGAVDDLLDTLVLARHGGGDGLTISLMVQGVLEQQVLAILEPQVDTFDERLRQRIADGIAALPPGGSIRRAMESERGGTIDWALEQVARDPREFWKSIGNLDPAKRRAIDEATGGTDEGLQRVITEAGAYFDEMARLEDRPDAEVAAAWAELETRANRDNPIAGILLPAYDKFRAREIERQARMAGFRAKLRGAVPE